MSGTSSCRRAASEPELELKPEIAEEIARLAAEIVVEQLDDRHAEQWPAAMTIETAARYTDSSPERLRKLVAARRIPFVQEGPGCAIRFLRTDLDVWLHTFRHEARGWGEGIR